MANLQIKVTQKDIDEGVRRPSYYDPFALALNRTYGKGHKACNGWSCIWVTKEDDKGNWRLIDWADWPEREDEIRWNYYMTGQLKPQIFELRKNKI